MTSNSNTTRDRSSDSQPSHTTASQPSRAAASSTTADDPSSRAASTNPDPAESNPDLRGWGPNDTRPPYGANYRDAFAILLARTLNDTKSLPYYLNLMHRWATGALMPKEPRPYVARLLLEKANELHDAAAPKGPIRNPAAVFVMWVKLL